MRYGARMTSRPDSAPVKGGVPVWRLAWRQTLRDLRAGELRMLALAVALAVAALTAVGFFADRIQGGLSRDARQLLGGDAVLRTDRPAPPTFAEQARQLGLRTATTVSFPSMARAPDERGGEARLVAVKAVSDGYPLRGRLTVSGDLARAEAAQSVAEGPRPGTAWVDPGVLDALGLRLGDRLWLGDLALSIERVILAEPDRGAGFMSFSPRVMLHADDLPATGLVQPASRISHRLLVAGDDVGVTAFSRAATQAVERGELRGGRLETLESGRPEMQRTLARAEQFLNLVALLAALLAAVAVAIGSRDFALRHLDDCAMLRVLGLSQGRIAAAYTLQFVAVGLVASGVGVGLGWGIHHGFVVLLAELVRTGLPPSGPWPAAFGLGVGLTLLLSFGLPPVLQLARVPPVRVIRRDLGTPRGVGVGVLVAGVAGFAALLFGVAGDVRLGAIAVGGFAGAIVLFGLLAWVAVQVLRRAVPESGAPRWLLLATRQVTARPAYAVLQVAALAVGLLALVLLVLLRTDLIDSWRRATPPDAPNRFVINIQPDQTETFRAMLRREGVDRFDWYPMFRGRLVAINGEPVDPQRYEGDRGRSLVEREFNLSHAQELPTDNPVVAGRWVPEEAEGLSVEEGLAQTLGLRLGDALRFDVAGQIIEARITSLRRVDWASMRVNFFVLFPRAVMSELPVTWISAYRAPPRAGFDRDLTRAFPNVTSVDVSASIAQVQRVLDQVIRAVEFLFVFTLAAGLVVLFAAVTATREARSREYALMRAMGAGQTLLARVQRAELLGVGALAGALASVAAMGVGWALALQVFEFRWNPSPWVPLAGTLAGALLAWGAGWWGLRGVLRRPVVETLRRAAAE